MHSQVFKDLATVVTFYSTHNSLADAAQVNPETGQPFGFPSVPVHRRFEPWPYSALIPFLADHVPQHLLVEGEVGDQGPERAVVLDLLEPVHPDRPQPAPFLFPVEVGRLADPSPTANLRDLDSVRSLLQNERLLGVREPSSSAPPGQGMSTAEQKPAIGRRKTRPLALLRAGNVGRA